MQVKKIFIFSLLSALNAVVYANTPTSPPSVVESSTQLSPDDLKALKKLAEKEKLADYSGSLGTAPLNKTVSSTGATLEETPSGPQAFIFWT